MNWLLNDRTGLRLQSLPENDLEEVVSLAERAFGSAYISGQVREMLSIYFASGADKLALAHQGKSFLAVSYYLLVHPSSHGKEILGMTGLYRPYWAGEGAYWLGWFATDARFHGCGYGIVLLRASMQLARAQGGRLLCVETSPDHKSALELYAKMGFQECGNIPDYWSPGNHLIILSRNLDDIKIPSGVDWNG